ncbi:hypothetical protein MF672_032980 [Actinomadura sp. ATCC 31491]|uniref:Acetophenone carboxylase n=1 Tax=Actinomadura luzonensis TaxID=2805427 RepID=A0ABT0G1X5_9ACTN|nr:hypothetical protein [Actinomadura luzonensis]MCK2218575.1 hypothetical protein [Actinomadura luzonensis]
MPAFNRLRLPEPFVCPNCHQGYEQILQFTYGYAWQFDYEIGDTVNWRKEPRADEGVPGAGRVYVEAILERACPHCGHDVPWPRSAFEIELRKDVIVAARPGIHHVTHTRQDRWVVAEP